MPNDTTEPPEGGTTTERGLPALVYKGEVIHERSEMLSLTDMWKAAGSPANRESFNWARFEGRSFVEAVALAHNLSDTQVMITKKGKGGGTFAHWQIALGYAKYLDHDFHMWCNRVVRERMEGAAHYALGLTADDRSAIGGIVKRVVPGIISEALALILPAMVREHVASNQHAVVEGLSAGQVMEIAGHEKRKGLRGVPVWLSHRLRHFHAKKGVAVRLASLGSRTALVYDPLTCREWLASGGKAELEQKIAERRGQGALRLV